jgi:hypothetical protein
MYSSAPALQGRGTMERGVKRSINQPGTARLPLAEQFCPSPYSPPPPPARRMLWCVAGSAPATAPSQVQLTCGP